MSTQHAAVWLDHEEAHIFHVDQETVERTGIQVRHHLHHPNKTGAHAETHRDIAEEHPFFDDIAKHLADVDQVLVLGPAGTKQAFSTYVERHHKDLTKKIVGVEACDHPTDGELIAHVRKYFLASDRMGK